MAEPAAEPKPEVKAAEEQFAKTMLEILQLSEFEAKDLTWMLFRPDRAYRDADYAWDIGSD